ncbi:MAG: LytR/AlgR family response regulator transcription factor [Moheibacter sp.]
MLRILLIDDEVKSIKSFQWELENSCKDVEVLATFTNPLEALDFLRKNSVDCVFLDVEMPQMDGFGFLNSFPTRDFTVVFVTAYDNYAIEAIKQAAVDYLLKPVNKEDLIATIEKVKSLKREEKFVNISLAVTQKYAFSVAGRIIYLKPEELVYCQSDGNYTRIFLSNNKSIYITKKIKEVHSKLNSNLFERVHNSYVINMLKVKEYFKTDGYVLLESNAKIPVSRSKRSIFLDQDFFK